MANRVTQGMMNIQLLRNLNNNMVRLERLQDQMSTGRRINKPSDDPVGISFSMRYRSELSVNSQYQRNVDSATSWLSYTDKMMDQAGQVLQRARELAVQGANGTNSEQSLKSMKSEMEQLYEQMVSIGNSKFNGKYVFNGERTEQIPFPDSKDAMNAVTDPGEIKFEIGLGVRMAVNKTADQVFGKPGESDNVFQVLQDLVNSLESQDQTAIGKGIEGIDLRMNKFLEQRADIGAKTNRIELAEDRLKDVDLNLQSLQSKTEDADLAKVITSLKMDENVYQASLSAGAKLIRPSLLDFLR
ncbi:flagellar hook-associated protein FlgL [Paenibacillus sp. GYB003]|uniref:flagellar hook-associated protein FlgL n=1 Tax=Paenibacillus sp. GYB003 TaxID=2994392 RepID=UPI002F96C235